MGDVLHIKGRILVGPEDVRDELWVVGGRVTYERPPAPGRGPSRAGCCPGSSTRTATSGSTRTAPSTTTTAEQQALTDRDAGALLLRDAGSPADTRWIDERDDLPRIIRAGRHIARTRRYIRNYAHEIEPERPAAYVRAGGPARRRLGQARRRLDRPRRRRPRAVLAARTRSPTAIAAAHEAGRPGHRALLRRGLARRPGRTPASTASSTPPGSTDETIPLFAEHGVAIVPTLVNIATFPRLAAGGEAKFPR